MSNNCKVIGIFYDISRYFFKRKLDDSRIFFIIVDFHPLESFQPLSFISSQVTIRQTNSAHFQSEKSPHKFPKISHSILVTKCSYYLISQTQLSFHHHNNKKQTTTEQTTVINYNSTSTITSTLNII